MGHDFEVLMSYAAANPQMADGKTDPNNTMQVLARMFDPRDPTSMASDEYKLKYSIQTQYKKILEVLSMPIPNPNPSYAGEMDHVDLQMVDRIVIEPFYVYSFSNHSFLRVSTTLKGDESGITIRFEFTGVSNIDYKMSLEEFEEIMFSVVHAKEEMRLEHTDRFKAISKSVSDQFCEQNLKRDALYLSIGDHVLSKGLGFIMDTKTGSAVGSFENIHMHIGAHNKPDDVKLSIHGLTLSHVSRDALKQANEGRYEYHYFVPSENRKYIFEAQSCSGEGDLHSVRGGTETYQDDVRNQLILSMPSYDPEIENQKNDFMNDASIESFRESRFAIIAHAQKAAAKSKIVNMFSDIDI